MFDYLKSDITRNLHDYGACGRLRKLGYVLTLNSVHAVALIRLQQWCAAKGVPTLIAAKLLFWFFKIEVSRSACIGRGIRLPHPMGIIIGPRVRLGEGCDLYAGVRLVLSHGDPTGPQVGDHVFMGDGAKVLGHVEIGSRVEIGASAVVTKSLPPGAVAAGIPARVLRLKADPSNPVAA